MKNLETGRDVEYEPALAEQAVQSNSELQQAELEETNGPKGLEPTRFGDWERKGRCIDF